MKTNNNPRAERTKQRMEQQLKKINKQHVNRNANTGTSRTDMHIEKQSTSKPHNFIYQLYFPGNFQHY